MSSDTPVANNATPPVSPRLRRKQEQHKRRDQREQNGNDKEDIHGHATFFARIESITAKNSRSIFSKDSLLPCLKSLNGFQNLKTLLSEMVERRPP